MGIFPLILTTFKVISEHSPSTLLYDEDEQLPNEIKIQSSQEFDSRSKRRVKNLIPLEIRNTKQSSYVPKTLEECTHALVRSENVPNCALCSASFEKKKKFCDQTSFLIQKFE